MATFRITYQVDSGQQTSDIEADSWQKSADGDWVVFKDTAGVATAYFRLARIISVLLMVG